MDAKRKSIEVCILDSEDFPDEDFPDDDKDRVWGGDIFRPGGDIRYFIERKIKGTHPIKGTKL